MENFGEYITKQYGISKKILSHLPISDLLNARKVCRDWYEIVNLIITNEFHKIPKVHFSEITSVRNDEEYEYWNNSKLIPEIVIKCIGKVRGGGKKSRYSQITLADDVKSLWKPIYYPGETSRTSGLGDLNGPTLIRMESHGCFSVSEWKGKKYEMIHSSLLDFGGTSTIALPKVQGVHYSVFSAPISDCNVNQSVFSIDELHKNKDKGPIRCILFYENCVSHSDFSALERIIHHIMRTVKKQQDTPCALGGGKVDVLNVWRSTDGKFNKEKPIMCGVIIRGENIIAHSDIMVEEITAGDMNNFMEQLAQRAGPTPEGAYRTAIIAQCVDRPHKLGRIYVQPETEIELLELSYFAKHFPDTPVCGFLAGGEFGTQADSHPQETKDEPASKIRRREVIDFYNKFSEYYMHWQSTSIVLLTFLNVLK